MNNDAYLNIKTRVKPALKKAVLLRGSFYGGLGILFIVMSSIYIPVEILTRWGLFIFLISLGMITYGLLPYRQLTRLEQQPNELKIQNKKLFFSQKGQILFALSLKSIERIEHLDYHNEYGIAIQLKKPTLKKITLYHRNMNIMEHLSKKQLNKDTLYLPYFSKKAYEELLQGVQD